MKCHSTCYEKAPDKLEIVPNVVLTSLIFQAAFNVLTTITAYHLPLYQYVAIAFRILVLSVRFIVPSVVQCYLVHWLNILSIAWPVMRVQRGFVFNIAWNLWGLIKKKKFISMFFSLHFTCLFHSQSIQKSSPTLLLVLQRVLPTGIYIYISNLKNLTYFQRASHIISWFGRYEMYGIYLVYFSHRV